MNKLSAEGLTHAINLALANADMRLRAEALGKKIRAEDGVSRAVEIVDGYLKHG
jgi:UDP:flavonoid glycosyltransferase YjiC (YdhE family)